MRDGLIRSKLKLCEEYTTSHNTLLNWNNQPSRKRWGKKKIQVSFIKYY